MEFLHYSVMLPQCMEGLNIKPDGIYIDGTEAARDIPGPLPSG